MSLTRRTLIAAGLLCPVVGCSLLSAPAETGRPGPDGPGSPSSSSAPAAADRPVLLTSLSDGQIVRQKYDQWGVTDKLRTLYGIDSGKVLRWDPDHALRWMNQHVPPAWDGYICLDWETINLKILRNGPADPRHRECLDQMIGLIQFVKSRRPNAKVGYYGLPLKEYWDQDEQFYAAMRAAAPLFDASDVLFPSVYDFYGHKPQRDHEHFGNIVRLALELAKGKPVFLFTWHRYHNSTKKWGFQLIPEQEYVSHVRHLVWIEHQGRRPAGVVAWGDDSSYYRLAHDRDATGAYRRDNAMWDRVRAAYAREMKPGEEIGPYLVRLNSEIYRRLDKALEPPKTP